jgi:predicted protein tyrosine phosphatase
MKILTICRGGQVRSVAAKFALTQYGHDVLAIGWQNNSKETLNMLCEWADYIVVMKDEFCKEIPDKFEHKMICYHVGPDRFGYAFHPELQQMIHHMIKKHGLFT